MKIVMGALAAVLLTGIGWSASAQAQGVPQGSYLRSCQGARVEGDTLVARCRRADGGEQRSALSGVNRCVGDIGNNNGQLQCSFGGPGRGQGAGIGGPGGGQGPGGGGPGGGQGAGVGGPGSGQGAGVGGPGREPAPGYGDRERYGERREGPDRSPPCQGVRREADELRERLQREYNPIERARTEGRLREVQQQAERCR
jgi:hypothetical protein